VELWWVDYREAKQVSVPATTGGLQGVSCDFPGRQGWSDELNVR
jgi:hypothetical protein